MSKHRFVRTVVLALVLAGSVEAQKSIRGLDPTSGRRPAPASKLERAHPRLAQTAGGQRTGYTTSQVAFHTLTLVDLFVASDDLVNAGNTLVPINSLDPGTLAGIDRLVVGLLADPLSAADMDAVEAYVLAGGDLVYLGENNTFFRDLNQQVGGRFGIEYPIVDPPQVVLRDIVDHPITNGPFGQVNEVDGSSNEARFFGSMRSAGPYGQDLVLFPGGNSAVVVIEPGALAPGAGSVIAFSEINIFFNTYALGDNRALWQNAFAYDPPSSVVTFDFQTDDFGTPLVNGQGILTPDEFGRIVSVGGFGMHTYGAAVFDSSPTGPNAGGSDPDLLVDLGNILILQESGAQSVPDIYDDLDDAQLGGIFVFDFVEPVEVQSLDLIDICPGPPNQDVTVTLFDRELRTRTYFVPGGWTNDRFQDGAPGFGTLDLTTLDPQPGFQATATAQQFTLFSPAEVVRLEVLLNSSGALDNLVVDTSPEPVPFQIVECSLGCSGSGFGQLSCEETDVHVNEELRITFNRPFDLATVNPNTFQVIEALTGQTPPGLFTVDPDDDRTLIWRPRLIFDSSGNPVFGLTEDSTYTLNIPGSLLDSFPLYIESTTGEPNATRLRCVMVVTQGVRDVVPGPPTVAITVFPDQPAQGAVDVDRETDVRFAFDDVMNPGTLLNSITGLSTTITVETDADGDPGTSDDRAPVPGFFTITIDLFSSATTVVFDPTGSLPAQTAILVTTTDAIEDLAGNALFNPGVNQFTTGQ